METYIFRTSAGIEFQTYTQKTSYENEENNILGIFQITYCVNYII